MNLRTALKKSNWADVWIVVEGNSAGLTVTDTMIVTAEVVSGMLDMKTAALKLYPNPASGQFRISVDSDDVLDLKVLSMTGKVLVDVPEYRSGDAVDMSRYPAGSYLVRVRLRDQVSTELLILR